jgi:hypothetical protein
MLRKLKLAHIVKGGIELGNWFHGKIQVMIVHKISDIS